MASCTRREFVGGLSASLCAAKAAAQQNPNRMVLWYRRPAEKWTDALPIGNGRLGAMVFGGVSDRAAAVERRHAVVGLTARVEQSGSESTSAGSAAAGTRRAGLRGRRPACAGRCRVRTTNPTWRSVISAFAWTDAEQSRTIAASSTWIPGISRVSYRVGAAEYVREAFASAPGPGDCGAADHHRPQRDGADPDDGQPGPFPRRQPEIAACCGSPERRRRMPTRIRPPGNPVVYDDADGKGMRFEASLQAVAEGGRMQAEGGALRIEGARAVTLLIAAATGYRGYDRDPDGSAPRKSRRVPDARVEAAREKPTRICAALTSPIIRRCSGAWRCTLPQLGSADLPTDERLGAFRGQSRSRPGRALFPVRPLSADCQLAPRHAARQPARHLERTMRPPWSSNWTANINVQMNYWPAETCNLAECHEPLFDLIEGLSKTGAKTAEVNYGCRGWVSHHNVDLWRQSAPVGNFGGGVADLGELGMSGPWLCAHLWEHYAFSGDREFLRATGLSADEVGRRVLSGLADRTQGRASDHLPVGIHREQFRRAGRPHRRDQRRLHHGYGADLRALLALHRGEPPAAYAIPTFARSPASGAGAADPLPDRQARPAPGMVARFRGAARPASATCPTCTRCFRGTNSRRGGTWSFGRRRGSRWSAGWPPAARTPGWSRAWAINFWARLLDGEKAWESVRMLFEAQHRAQPVRYPPFRQLVDLPDRREFRRDGGDRRNAAAEPRSAESTSCRRCPKPGRREVSGACGHEAA